MKLKLTDVQMEQITVTYLDQVHHDLKCELEANELEQYLDPYELTNVVRSIVAVETIMRDLMFEDHYHMWKLENGVEL